MIVTVIVGLLVLSVLILVHELGHFLTARAFRIRVDEFGIGFPPRLLGIRRGETMYSVNAVPFGGFVKMAGEEDPALPRSLAGKGIGARLLVLGAGSLANILLPLVLFPVAFMVPHDVVTGQVLVAQVAPDSPADRAGIQAGDIVLSMNGKPVRNIAEVHRHIQFNLGEETAIAIQHSDGTTREVKLIPRLHPPEGEGAIGVRISLHNLTVVTERLPFWEAVPMGVAQFAETFLLFAYGIVGTVTGALPGEVIGPVGIVQVTGEVAKTGIAPLLQFAALLSLIVGVINLFPIPALDGGRIVFVLLEWIRRGKRVSPKTEGRIHLAGFIVLISLILLVTYRDILRIVTGDSLVP